MVAHHGSVARQRMAGREELVGSDVVVVHRLLKNRIAEDLGVPAYRVARPRSAQDRRVAEAIWDQIRPGVEQDGATLIELAAADAAARAADSATEPNVPANTARHLSEPLPAAGGPIDYLPDDGGAGK